MGGRWGGLGLGCLGFIRRAEEGEACQQKQGACQSEGNLGLTFHHQRERGVHGSGSNFVTRLSAGASRREKFFASLNALRFSGRMSSDTPAVQLQEVVKTYSRGEAPVAVLKGVSLVIQPGELVAVVGPSGSGKSTLLNIIGTLDEASEGTVTVDGESVGGMDEVALAAFRNQRIGFVFQSHHLLPQCTVLENVLLPTLASRDPRVQAAARERAPELLKRVGLDHRMGHRPGQLSGGECQRVAVVRALINRPKLLLADEPTGALDQQSAQALIDLLLELNRDEKVTLVVVTHAMGLADRMTRRFELKDGRLPVEER